MGTYADLFQKNQYDVHNVAKKSRTWFQQQALLLSKEKPAPLALIREDPSKNILRIIPGDMVLFAYDAKLQDTLPYWDMFPLVFPFRRLKDGFIGLNMHYLPYQMRVQLLDRLMDYRNNTKMDHTTKLKYSWNLISGVSRFKLAEPCVHRYLMDHVQSPFRKIDANDWGTALMLPVERFVGASKQRVWSDSLK